MRAAYGLLVTACSQQVLTACSQQAHLLGYDVINEAGTPSLGTTSIAPVMDAAARDADTEMVSSEPDASITSQPMDAAVGNNDDAGLVSVVLMDPPNVLVDVLGVDPERVVQRTSTIFEQLFFGDPVNESIYVDDPAGAYVFDVYHEDTRMDAMGYAMLALPYFDRQDVYDKLWATVDTKFRYTTGARSGYFHQSCATDFSSCSDDVDTFGVFFVVTSLFMAERRWGGGSYAQAANEMLTTMLSKEQNGVVEGVLNLFSPDGLPRRRPLEADVTDVWAGALMPAFFEVWYVYTREPFWHEAAVQSRALLKLVGHPETGLAPERVDRLGQPTQEMPEFREGCYGVGFQMALDQTWVGTQPGYAAAADLLVRFFSARPGYPSTWTIDGEALSEYPSLALIALNATTASIATLDAREAMMRSAWEMAIPTATFRYYDGMSLLLSLMFLGGQLKPT